MVVYANAHIPTYNIKCSLTYILYTGIDMLDWLPEFLDGLFNMLSDGNREIRQV